MMRIIEYIQELDEKVCRYFGFLKEETPKEKLQKEFKRITKEGKKYVRFDDLEKYIKSLTGPVSGALGRAEEHIGEVEKKVLDVKESKQKMDEEIRFFGYTRKVFFETSSKKLKEFDRKTCETVKKYMEDIKKYVEDVAKYDDNKSKENKKMFEDNVEVLRKKFNDLENMLKDSEAEKTKEVDDMHRKIKLLMGEAKESIEASKELARDSDRKYKEAIYELKNAYVVILHLDGERKFVKNLFERIEGDDKNEAKRMLNRFCAERYEGGMGPILEAAAEIAIEKGKKQEGLH